MWAYQYVNRDDIMHYGVPGMKWGVRRKIARNAIAGARYTNRADLYSDRADRLAYRKKKRAAKGKNTTRISKRLAKNKLQSKKFRALATQSTKGLSKKDIRRGQLEYQQIMKRRIGS